jgi:hypothetical protein
MVIQVQPGHPPSQGKWTVGHQGTPFNLPSIGGITLNMQVGDPAFGWAGDHLEPGVSATACSDTQKHPNGGAQYYSCAGNVAEMISGRAKGAKGVVLGHHGGSEHLVIDFPRKDKMKMSYDDKMIIHTKGQGLALLDYPEISVLNLDPRILKLMKIKELKSGRLEVPVTTIVPAECMGSGLGVLSSHRGDYDIMTSDEKTVKQYKLDELRFGDFVAIMDHYNLYGPTYKQGAVSIGIVIHSDCVNSGHGPGVTTIMTCEAGQIVPKLNKKSCLADFLKIGTQV